MNKERTTTGPIKTNLEMMFAKISHFMWIWQKNMATMGNSD